MSGLEQPTLFQPPVNPEEIARKQTWAAILQYAAELAGYCLDKQSCPGMDKARWSRIKSGQEGIKPEQLEAFLDSMGNDAPLLWLMHRRGWDLHSFRKRETETERENRLLREENAALRRVLTGRTP